MFSFLLLKKSPNITICIFLYVLFSFLTSESHADKLFLKDGSSILCVIVKEDNQSILVETETGTITFPKSVVVSIEKETAELNFIHRGDFFVKKGKLEEALSQYGQALALNPASTLAKEKYRELREKIETIYIQQLWTRGKKGQETHELTAEDYEAIKARGKGRKKEKVITITATGTSKIPENIENEKKAEKIALSLAKANALKSALGEAAGIGFIVKNKKIFLMQPWELPTCKIKVIDKGKINGNYIVKTQIELPVSSFLLKIPEGLETYTVEGTGDTFQFALENAYRKAITNAMEKLSTNKKIILGRLFEVGPREEKVESEKMIKIRSNFKVWFSP